jgi:predicted Ser/Thr protein kinase
MEYTNEQIKELMLEHGYSERSIDRAMRWLELRN